MKIRSTWVVVALALADAISVSRLQRPSLRSRPERFKAESRMRAVGLFLALR